MIAQQMKSTQASRCFALAIPSFVAAGCLASLVAGATALADASPRLIARASSSAEFQASADGSVVAVTTGVGRPTGRVTVYNVRTGTKRTISLKYGTYGVYLTRDARKIVYSTWSSLGLYAVDLRSNKTSRFGGYTFLTLDRIAASGDGRYISVVKGFNQSGNPVGILDLKTRRFVRLPRPAPRFTGAGVQTMSGDGDWVIYRDISANRPRCYSFSRITRARHPLPCEIFAGMSDDGRVALLGSGNVVNARTGKALPGFLTQPGPGKYLNFAGNIGTLSADGARTAVRCRTAVFTVDLASGVYSRVPAVSSTEAPVLTANGNALVYWNARGIYEATTASAIPTVGIPDECVTAT